VERFVSVVRWACRCGVALAALLVFPFPQNVLAAVGFVAGCELVFWLEYGRR
jgi:hypothetical protein